MGPPGRLVAVKRILVTALTIAFVAGCGESLNSGGSCPALCPEQSLPVQEAILDLVELDTTVGPYPIRGTELGLMLASRGDTLDVRAVARFDSLPDTYLKDGEDIDITAVDSSRVFIRLDTTVVNFDGAATIEVYDVDTTAADTSVAALSVLFRPDRLLGTANITSTYFLLDDTLSIAIPNDSLLDKIQNDKPLRLGFRFVGTGDITLHSAETGLPVLLRFDPAPGDTAVASRIVGLFSNSPSTDLIVANDLRDYSIVVTGEPAPTERLSAGGLPAYRSYLRFNVPAFYLDSVVIVRAQLLLTQRPVTMIDEDTLATVYPVVGSAHATVTDLQRAAQLVYPPFSFAISPLVRAPSDSGTRSIDMVQLFRQWSLDFKTNPRPVTAVVLRGGNEGRATGRIAFFGLDAAPDLRPKLRIAYVARSRFGIP